MPSVGSAYVNIRVNTKGFEAGLDKMLARMSTKMEAAGTKLGKDFEKGLNKTNFDGVFNKLTAASGNATDTVANDINKITTEARVAKDAVGDLSGSLREAGNSSRQLKLGGIGGGGGGGGLRQAAGDASFLESQISSLAQAVPSATKMISGLYNAAAFGGTAIAGAAGGISAAAQSIFTIGANAAAAAPAVAILANGLMSLGQVGGVVALATRGVGAALKAGFASAEKGAVAATGAVGGMGAATRAAARAVRDAKDALADAYRDAARAAEDAARKTADAERALAAAARDTAIAQRDLNAAFREGREEMEDIAFSAEEASLAEERAKLALLDAQKGAAEVSSLAPDDRQRVEAELTLQEAELAFREAKDRREDTTREQKKSAKEGVAGTDAVRTARERLADAHETEQQAIRDLNDARRNEARVAQDNAEKIADAQQGVADAQQGLADAQKQGTKAMTAAATAADKFDVAMAKLGPNQRKFVKRILGMREEFQKFSNKVSEPLFGHLLNAIDTLEGSGLTGIIQDGLRRTSDELGTIAENAAEVAASPAFKTSLSSAMKSNNDAIEIFGGTITNLELAFIQLADAAGPLFKDFATWTEDLTDTWGVVDDGKTPLNEADEHVKSLRKTINTAGDRVKEFWDLATSLWDTLIILGSAANTAANGFGKMNEKGKPKGYIPTLTENLDKFNQSLKDNPDLAKNFGDALDNFNSAAAAVKEVVDPLIKLGQDPNVGKAFDIIAENGPTFDRLGDTAADAAPALADLAVSILDILGAIGQSGGMQTFMETLASAAGLVADIFTKISDNKYGKMFLGIAAGVFAVQRAIKLMKGVVKTVIAGTLGPLITSLDNTFKKRKFKATGGVDPNATAKVAGAGGEAKEGTWENLVLNELRLIHTAIVECCATMSRAMGVAGAKGGAAGAAGAAGLAGAGTQGKVAGGLAGAAPAAGTTSRLGKFAGIFGKLGKFIGPIGKGLKVFSFALRGVGFALRFMMGPWGMLILTLLPILWPLIKKLNDKFGIMDKVMKALRWTLDKVIDVFQWLWDKIKELFNWVKDNWPKILAIITGPIGIAVYLIIKKWDKIVNFIKGVPDKIKNALSGMWDFILDKLEDAWEAVKSYWWTAVAIGDEIERRLKDGLAHIWDVVKDSLVTVWVKVKKYWWKAVEIGDKIEARMKRGLRKIWNVVKDKLVDVWAAVKRIWGRIITWIKGRPAQFMRNLRALWNIFKDGLRIAWDKAKEIWGRITTWVKGRPDQFKRNLAALWSIFKTGLSAAWEWVKTKWTSIKTAIGKWPSQIKDKLANIWNGMGSGLISAINWVGGKVNWLIGKLNGILDKFKAPNISVSWPTLSWKGFATGGPVMGPGGPTSDSIAARLSHGEHVLTAREVKAMGGHSNVIALRKAAMRGEEPGTGGIIGWVKNKYDSVKDALKKGMETAFKWVLSKFKGMVGTNDNIVKNTVLGALEWASTRITDKGKDADDAAARAAAAAAAAGGGKPYTGPPGGWTYPLARRYGITQMPNSGHRPSWSVDIGAPGGTGVRAASRGTVASVISLGNRSYGNYVVINHAGGQQTLYAHLRSFAVKAGQSVRTGQTIGYSDSTGHSTGNHLHFELKPSSSTYSAMAAHGVKLGMGGVVAPSAAGTLALIAEAGQHERVTPLDSEGFTPAERRMLEALETSLGGGGGDQYHVHPAPGMSETHLADLVARRVAWKRRRGAGWR